MSKVTGSVRVWYAEQGWGVFDSAETPGGCWADAKEVMPMEQPLDLHPGSPVRFDWTDISFPDPCFTRSLLGDLLSFLRSPQNGQYRGRQFQ